jgi:hypothetical protein
VAHDKFKKLENNYKKIYDAMQEVNAERKKEKPKPDPKPVPVLKPEKTLDQIVHGPNHSKH